VNLDHVAVQAALCVFLVNPPLAGSPAIAMPLVTFVPTPGVSYLDARPVLRAEPEQFGLDYNNVAIHRGIFQVDAVIADGKGEAPGLRLAGLVADRFAIGTKFVVAGLNLEITGKPAIAGAVKDAPWVRFPVSIPFRLIV
jgi:hypothetical protein